MPSFSRQSRDRLAECHPDLQAVANDAIQHVDFTVLKGYRGEQEQNKLFPQYTSVRWPLSKHNRWPSDAFDFAPYVEGIGAITGSDKQVSDLMVRFNTSEARVRSFVHGSYGVVIGGIHCSARRLRVSLRFGADWDGDGILVLDHSLADWGHVELV